MPSRPSLSSLTDISASLPELSTSPVKRRSAESPEKTDVVVDELDDDEEEERGNEGKMSLMDFLLSAPPAPMERSRSGSARGSTDSTITDSPLRKTPLMDEAVLVGSQKPSRKSSVNSTIEDDTGKHAIRGAATLDISLENALALPENEESMPSAFNVIHEVVGLGVYHQYHKFQPIDVTYQNPRSELYRREIRSLFAEFNPTTYEELEARDLSFLTESIPLSSPPAPQPETVKPASARESVSEDMVPGRNDDNAEGQGEDDGARKSEVDPVSDTNQNQNAEQPVKIISPSSEEQKEGAILPVIKTECELSDAEKTKYEPTDENGSSLKPPRVLMRQSSNEFNGVVVIRYEVDDDGTPNKFSIAAGTMEKLVERLADENGPAMRLPFLNNFVDDILSHIYSACFLIPFKSVISTLTRIISFFSNTLSVRPAPDATQEQIEYVRKWKPIIRVRTVAVVRRWIDQLWDIDFHLPQTRQALSTFIRSISSTCFEDDDDEGGGLSEAEIQIDCNRLKGLLCSYIKSKMKIQASEPIETPEEPSPAGQSPTKHLTILDIDPVEIAQELTRLEYERLRDVRPIEFVLQLWSNRNDPLVKRATLNLERLVRGFNTVSYWVGTEICTQPELKSRVKVIERIIKVGKECKKLRNYNTLLAIISGLNIASVARLKNTWEANAAPRITFSQMSMELDSKKLKELQEFEILLNPQHNYRSYRGIFEALERDPNPPPCIPIMSIFMKDMVFINDGNPKYFDNNLINFGKLRMIYKKLAQLTVIQKTPFMFSTPTSDKTTGFVRNLRALRESSLHKYSLLCEAKAGDTGSFRLLNKWREENTKR
ncbi:hypothetical protein HK102_004664 [Quaeritorhiza haematococci]|nr:hypothetical protein HK102_004664 [Quaeritorhiza haematococci]